MIRDPNRLAKETFDVLVIGAGIHGACIARDASLRGLKVALIDKGDLGGSTSHNSLKTIHGGVRYLQHLNFKRTIESIREQMCFRQTLASHVRPLPFLMPTYGWGLRGPLAMWVAFQIYNVLVLGTAVRLGHSIPSVWSKVIGRGKCLSLLGDSSVTGITGGALWPELQVEQADLALLDIIADSERRGGCVASYVSVDSFQQAGDRITGVEAVDLITGQGFAISAKTVVNATGPWVEKVLHGSGLDSRFPVRVHVSKSMNVVVNRPSDDIAVGVQSRHASDSRVGATKRLYFKVPWKGLTLVGTTHSADVIDPDSLTYDQADIDSFREEINQVFPELALDADDVLYCYQGLTPLDEPDSEHASVLHHSLVIDHAEYSSLESLVSVVGVKWTTARLVAEKTVDIVARKLGSGKTSTALLEPVPIDADRPGAACELDDSALAAFCLYHVDRTMPCRLADLLLRRTDDFVLGRLSLHQVEIMARTMAERLGWDQETCEQEHAGLLASAIPDTRKQVLLNLKWWD